MLFIFFDEVKIQPDYPFYHIGGVCLDEEQLIPIQKEMSAIAKDIFGTDRLSRETEIHAQHIWSRSGSFGVMENFGDRVKMLERLIKILGREEVKLIRVTIDSSKPQASARPAEIAFMYFCERADQYAQSQNKIAMLIGDRDGKNSDRFSISLSDYQDKGTEFAFGYKIKNLFESVHFTHSYLNRFLQLADVYTWVVQFWKKQWLHNYTDDKHLAVMEIFSQPEINMFPVKYKDWPKK